jgi:hypothetical protein
LSLENLAAKGNRTIIDTTNDNLTVKQNVEKNNIDESKINPNFQPTKKMPSIHHGNISIAIESHKISKKENEFLFETKLWINGSDLDLKK